MEDMVDIKDTRYKMCLEVMEKRADGIWTCLKCNYIPKKKVRVQLHLESIHIMGPDIPCDICDNICPNKNALRCHKQRFHSCVTVHNNTDSTQNIHEIFPNPSKTTLAQRRLSVQPTTVVTDQIQTHLDFAPTNTCTYWQHDRNGSENVTISGQDFHENNPNPLSQAQSTGSSGRRYGLANETSVEDNTSCPPSSTNANQEITPGHVISSVKNVEAMKEASIKLLFALDDMVKNNLE